MKLHLLSDLHLEFFGFTPPQTDADVVILAGDIGLGADGVEWAARAFPDKPVIYVGGNHEAYGWDMSLCRTAMDMAARGTPNVTILENASKVFTTSDGRTVRILGTTLWTDFALYGADKVDKHGPLVNSMLNDYRVIKVGTRMLTWRDTLAYHEQSRAWLEQECEQAWIRGETIVVVTHHAPSLRSSHPRYRNDPATAGFASNMEAFAKHYVGTWIHGHVHDSVEYELGDCRVLANPRGYPQNRMNPATRFENPNFNPALVVEV